MFFYSFSTYHGFDRVVRIDTQQGNPGDLFLINEKYMLCLGEKISFQSLYENHIYNTSPESAHQSSANSQLILIEPSLLSPLTIQLIHEFVATRFTTYKNSLPLWISEEIDILLKRKPITKKKSEIRNQKLEIIPFDTTTYNIYNGTPLKDFNQALNSYLLSPISGIQRLIVFPSLWIMSQTLDIVTLQQKSGYLVLHHNTSPKQKDDAFRALKTGSVHTLICTHSEIFHDWDNLKYILLIDQHSRLYKHQQDPKFHILDVCKGIATKYQADIDFTGISHILNKSSG